MLRPEQVATSYAAYLIEFATERGLDLRESSAEHVLVAGEPAAASPPSGSGGGGVGVADRGDGDRRHRRLALGGAGTEQDGMHLGARGFVHAELIDPESGAALEFADGASGELVSSPTSIIAVPPSASAFRDHVRVRTSPCPRPHVAPRVRCIGRTDDMLIVRGVNVFPRRSGRQERVRSPGERQRHDWAAGAGT